MPAWLAREDSRGHRGDRRRARLRAGRARPGAGTEPELRAAIAAQMAQGPAAAGAYVVDLSDGHVVLDDRGDDEAPVGVGHEALHDLDGAAGAWARGACRDPRARHRPPQGRDVERRPVPPRGRRLHVRHAGVRAAGRTGRARASRAWPRGCGALGCGGSAATCSATRRCTATTAGRRSSSSSAPTRCSGATARTARPASSSARSRTVRARRSASTAGLPARPAPSAQRRPARFAARGLIRALRRAASASTAAPAPRRTPERRARLAADALAHRRAAHRAGQPAVGQLRGRLDAPAGRRAGRRATAPAQAARAPSRARSRARSGCRPEIRSGSGETILDRTSPRELVRLLTGMRARPEGPAFARSLSQAGRNGTLLRFAGTVAEGRCQLKDGTRVDPEQPNTTLNITGYCTSVSGRTFAFAVMMNGMPLEFVPPDQIESPAYALQDAIVKALAGYRG